MSSSENMVVALTRETTPGVFPQGDGVKVLHSGGNASMSQSLEEDPRKTGDGQVADYLDVGHTGTWPVPAPLVFMGPWDHLEGAFRAKHSDLVDLTSSTVSFNAAQNKIVTTVAGEFDRFAAFVGMSLIISGSSVDANNTGFDNVAILEEVTGTELKILSELHSFTDAAAGDAVKLSVGYALKNGTALPVTYACEEGYFDEIVAATRADGSIAPSLVVSADGLTNKLIAPEGTFAEFQGLAGTETPITVLGFAQAENQTDPISQARVVSLAASGGNDELELGGIALATEAAGNPITVWAGGSYAQATGLVLDSFEVTSKGGALVETSASYQVGEFQNALTHRSLGSGDFLPYPGQGNPTILSRHTEASILDTFRLRARDTTSVSWKYENGLEYTQPDGSAGRADPKYGKFKVSGSFEMNHSYGTVHALYEKQMKEQSMPYYRRYRDALGNRVVFGIPHLCLGNGVVDRSGNRAMFKPNLYGKTDPLLKRTAFVQWIPA